MRVGSFFVCLDVLSGNPPDVVFLGFLRPVFERTGQLPDFVFFEFTSRDSFLRLLGGPGIFNVVLDLRSHQKRE